MSSLKLRELAASYSSYGSELSFRAQHATCVARSILRVCDRVGRFYRGSRGLEDADWLMLPACLLAACARDQLLRAG